MDPCLFSLSSAVMQHAANETLEEFWPLLGPPAVLSGMRFLPVLDFGCFTGDVTAHVLGPRIPSEVSLCASDANTNMLDFAYCNNFHPSIYYGRCDITLPGVEATAIHEWRPYSKVFSFNALQWLPNQSKAFGFIHKWLVTGGVALVTIIAKSNLFNVYTLMAKQTVWGLYMQDVEMQVSQYQNDLNPARKAQKILHDLGFNVMVCETTLKAFIFNNEEEFKGFITAINPFVSRMPYDRRHNYMSELLDWCYKFLVVTIEKEEPSEMFPYGREVYKMNYLGLTILAQKL